MTVVLSYDFTLESENSMETHLGLASLLERVPRLQSSRAVLSRNIKVFPTTQATCSVIGHYGCQSSLPFYRGLSSWLWPSHAVAGHSFRMCHHRTRVQFISMNYSIMPDRQNRSEKNREKQAGVPLEGNNVTFTLANLMEIIQYTYTARVFHSGYMRKTSISSEILLVNPISAHESLPAAGMWKLGSLDICISTF
jgi:hypothetical protein